MICGLVSKIQVKWEIMSNFCGLLRIYELYLAKSKGNKKAGVLKPDLIKTTSELIRPIEGQNPESKSNYVYTNTRVHS